MSDETNSDEGEAESLPSLNPDWPDDVKSAIQNLFGFDGSQLEGKVRLGDLAFDGLSDQLAAMQGMILEIHRRPWATMPTNIAHGGLRDNTNEAVNVLMEIRDFDLKTVSNPSEIRQQLLDRFNGAADWYRNNVSIVAEVERLKRQVTDDSMGEQARQLHDLLEGLSARTNRLAHDLDQREDVVDSVRISATQEAAEDLTTAFSKRAGQYKHRANVWLGALGIAIGLTIMAAYGAYSLLDPGTTDNLDIGRLTFTVFALGLLIYAVRVCGQQHRSARHLEAVALSKEATTDTFGRLVSSIKSDEVRATATLVLAQSVFAVEDTGLNSGGAEQVTLVERAVLPQVTGSSPSP